jgi:hypothetical protein
MRLRNAMFAGWIARFAFLRNELALASEAALKLRSDFVAGLFFKRICATAREREIGDRDQDRPGFHPLILGTPL